MLEFGLDGELQKINKKKLEIIETFCF